MTEEDKILLNTGLVREYEELIRSMRNQLSLYKEEHTILKKELNELLLENQLLNEKLSFEFKQKIKDESIPKIIESEMVANLKNQLELCKREKEKMFELYQASNKLIEKLEDEIKTREKCQIGASLEGRAFSVTSLEAKLKTTREHLELERSNREQLEREIVKHQTEIAKLKLNVEASRASIEDLKEKDRKWKDKYVRMEQEHTLLNATLECVTKSRNDLEAKLDLYGNKIQALSDSYNDAKCKVSEALDLVERAVSERDASLVREAELQKEASKLQLCLKHVIDEAGRKVSEELDEMRKKYDSNMHKIMKEVPMIRSELENKTMELKKMTVKFKRLEKASSAKLDKEKISLIKGSETEIAMLESQLDSTYKEIERVKLKNEELVGEKTRAEDDLSKLQASYQILMRSKEREEKKTEEEIQTLREQLQKKVEDLAEFSKRTEFFLTRIRELQTENRNLLRLVETTNAEKAKMKKALDIRTTQVGELEEHVDSLKVMNEKWKNEIKGMTEEFEMRIKEVKKECNLLKKKNWEVVKELEAARKTISIFDKVD